MNKLIAFLLIVFPVIAFSQHPDIAPGWEKEKDRLSIDAKMDELINRVSFETECDTSQISYIVLENYDYYGRGRDDKNFPKTVTIKACGENINYFIDCPPNATGKPKGWLAGDWTLIEEEKEEQDEK